MSANWTLSDGSVTSPHRGRMRSWLEVVHRAAVRAGWRPDGRYAPIDGLDVVLAGDTFDWFSSAAWLAGPRPWDRGDRAAAVRTSVMLAAARQAGPLLGRLARWTRSGLDVPRAGRHGRPALHESVAVPVRVTLLSGDRDPWLAGAAGPAARHGIGVGRVWSDGRVLVAHAADGDLSCAPGDEPGPGAAVRPTLAASLAIDLVARLAGELRQGGAVAPGLIAALSAAPVADLPRTFRLWLRGQAGGHPGRAAAVSAVWVRAVRAWRREARRSGADDGFGFDGIAALAAALESASTTGDREPDLDCAWLRTASAAPPPSLTAGRVELVVLGHPRGPLESGPPSAVVRLGGRTPDPGGAGVPGSGAQRLPPPTVACRRWRGGLVVEVLSPCETGSAAAGVAVASEAA